MNLQHAIRAISGGEPLIYRQAIERWNSLEQPWGHFGTLKDAVARMAALTRTVDVRIDKRMLLVFCADNGIAAQGADQSDSPATEQIACALGTGRSVTSHLAQSLHCQVRPIDVGMRCPQTPEGTERFRIRSGTEDVTCGPAMPRLECLSAMATGFQLAKQAKSKGTQILLSGETGAGNSTVSVAVLSVLLGRSPRELLGQAGDLPEGKRAERIQAIQRAVDVNRPDPRDPIDVLQKVGGLTLAALCGLSLGGAYYRIPVLLDGPGTLAAALCAARLCPNVKDALLISYVSAEPAAELAMRELALQPLFSAQTRLEEGRGAMAALPLLDMALRIYHSGAFDSIEIHTGQG